MSKKKTATKPNRKHPSRRIAIKTANVDIEMIGIVEWLNSFKDIHTLYCCQGGELDGVFQLPYVVWVCHDSLELIQALKDLGHVATTRIEWYEHGSCLRYLTEFNGMKNVAWFVENLSKMKAE